MNKYITSTIEIAHHQSSTKGIEGESLFNDVLSPRH